MLQQTVRQLLSGERSTRALFALALFVWLAGTAWMRPLSLPDEGRYVGVAMEMVTSGDWLTPTLNSLPYFHKPPLFYWLTAASLATFGLNEWAARLASILAATGAGFALYLFLGRWVGENRARLALLVLATTPFFMGGAQFANLDTLVMACIAATILCAADAVLAAEGNRPRRLTLAGAYVFAALGVLAKGLIGIAIPGLVILAWLLLSGRASLILRLIWLPGLVLFSLIAVPWFALMETRHPGFLSYFFIHHHLERFTTGHFNGHEPFWFYVPVFLGVTLPWSVFLIPAALRLGAVERRLPPVAILMWLWLVITIVFFSIPASKLIGYVLVALPPFAALAASGLEHLARTPARAWRWGAGVATAAAFTCVAVITAALMRDRDNIAELIRPLRPLLSQPNTDVVTFRTYPFSLAFYLRTTRPIPIALNWDDPRILEKDNWRQELHEAAAFDPARARKILLAPDQLTQLLACSTRTTWVITPISEAGRHPEFTRLLQRVAANGQHVVWRSTPARTPQDNPACGP